MAASSLPMFFYFYPRPPRGGRRQQGQPLEGGQKFLSTPSARRATFCQPDLIRGLAISIHALREEGDDPGYHGRDIFKPFLSTPSARRATVALFGTQFEDLISIHALREEGDKEIGRNPRTVAKFLSTPSARRATAKTETKSLFSTKLYNILHEFRRALIYNGSKNDPNHAK